MLHAKDGKSRQPPRGAASRPGKLRALVASVTVVAGIGALLAACGLAHTPRRKRRIAADPTPTDIRLQQITRYRAADGTHCIHGTLLAEFESGDRSATLYVAICPPFERLPIVEAEAVDDSSATVKLSQVLHNGVQIDVRLSEPSDEKQTATIEFTATEPPPLAA